jgi:hypothetical protein
MGERRGLCRILVGRLEGNKHLEDQGVDGRIILSMDLQEVGYGSMGWTDLA